MGDINMNSLNDINAAEQNFLKILDTEPRNVQANHNLCVVYVERGDLHRAEKCLSETLQLAPQEDYIKQHLGIVRNKIRLAEQVSHCELYLFGLVDSTIECYIKNENFLLHWSIYVTTLS